MEEVVVITIWDNANLIINHITCFYSSSAQQKTDIFVIRIRIEHSITNQCFHRIHQHIPFHVNKDVLSVPKRVRRHVQFRLSFDSVSPLSPLQVLNVFPTSNPRKAHLPILHREPVPIIRNLLGRFRTLNFLHGNQNSVNREGMNRGLWWNRVGTVLYHPRKKEEAREHVHYAPHSSE